MTREEAARKVKSWHDFVGEHPDALRLTPVEFIERYGSEVWKLRESVDAASIFLEKNQPETRQETHRPHQHHPSALTNIAFLPLGFLFNTDPEVLEEHSKYLEVEEEVKKQWLKDHPQDKDFSTQEGIDYLYGSEDPNASSLHRDTLNKIKEYSDQHKLYSENKDSKEHKQYKKYYDLRQKYEKKESEFKPKKKPSEDPYVVRTERLIREETDSRFKLLNKEDSKIKKEDIEAQVKARKWREFAENHFDRAKAYADQHEEIKKAYQAREPQTQVVPEAEQTTSQVPMPDKIQETPSGAVPLPDTTPILTSIEEPSINQPTYQTQEKQKYAEQKNQELFGELKASRIPPETYSPPPQQRDSQPRRPSFNRIGQEFNKRVLRRGGKGVERQAEKQAAKKGIEKIGEQLGKQLLKQVAQKAAMWLLSLFGTQAIVLLLILGFTFFLVGFGGGGLGAGSDNTGGTGGGTPPPTPPPSSVNSLDYTIPFRDFSVAVPEGTKEKIKNQFPSGKLDNFDIIVRESKNNKWNPMFVLALWMEESGAQSASSYSDALGCAPQQPTSDINVSLKCLFNNFPISRYANENFADFMCVYGGDGFHRSPCTFNTENPDFPKNIKKFYSLLVPSGKGALQTINTSTTSDCPVPNGTITTYSFDKDPQSGHCAPNYGSCGDDYLFCPTNNRRSKSIDMVGEKGNKNVYLPTIFGEKVSWEYIQRFPVSQSEGGGNGYMFKTGKGSDYWYLQLLHMGETNLSPNSQYPSGTLVGPYYTDHVHITIGKNIKNPLGSGTQSTNCDEGWLPAENICTGK